MAAGMTTAAMIIAVVVTTSVAAVIAAVVAAFIAHVVAQSATRATTGGCANQAAGTATDTAADHVTTGSTEAAANGGFSAVALVCTHRATRRTAKTGADGRTCTAAQLLTDDRTEYPTQCSPYTGFRSAAG